MQNIFKFIFLIVRAMYLIYAALLLHDSGKEVNEENLKKVVEAVDVKVEEGQVKALVSALKDVDIEEVISKAQTQAVQVQAAPPTDEKEVKEEKKEEEAVAGLASLFG